MNVPDAITPVEGYRAWGLGLGRLWSMRAPTPTPWPTCGPLRARCLKNRSQLVGQPEAGCHDAPTRGCSCGVYAAWEPWDIESIPLRPPFELVVGWVWGWGRVVLGTRGWRAEYVQPVELFAAPWWSESARGHVSRVADTYALPLAEWSANVGRLPDRVTE